MFAQALVTFRESFEALVLVVLIVSLLRRSGRSEDVKFAYAGTVAAVILGTVLGFGILRIYGGFEEKELFEALSSFLAVAVLTSVILWMAGKDVRSEVESRVGKKLKWGVAAVTFFFVVREVVETLLFLTPYFVDDPRDTVLGVVSGILLASALSYAILWMGRGVSVRKLFYYTSVLLVFVASALIGQGTHELVEYLEENGYESWAFEKAFDLGISESSLLHNENVVGSILAVFGYSVSMEFARAIVQFGYLFATLLAVLTRYGALKTNSSKLTEV